MQQSGVLPDASTCAGQVFADLGEAASMLNSCASIASQIATRGARTAVVAVDLHWTFVCQHASLSDNVSVQLLSL